MPADLIDAVVEQLEASTMVTTAFGDTWNQIAQTGVSKFFTDIVDQVPIPWAQILEIGESYDYQTEGPIDTFPYISTGQLLIAISASDRYQARQLGVLVAATLNDAPLVWDGGFKLMLLRLTSASFVVQPSTGPAVPTMFRRLLTFNYQYSGDIA